MASHVVFVKHPPLHEPSQAQKDAGNYKKRKIAWQDMEIAIENEPGSFRRGTNRDGESWEQRMANAYGYLRGTTGVDGDHVDVFVGPHPDTAENVYVVHARKINRWDEYDEDKCMVGFAGEDEAREAFLANYNDPRFLGDITTLPVAEFVTKVKATFDEPGMVKSEQLSLFATVHVEGSTKKDGTVTKPYTRVQHVKPPAEKKPEPVEVKEIKLTPAQVSAFEINVLDPAHDDDDDPGIKLLRESYKDGVLRVPMDKVAEIRHAIMQISNSEDKQKEDGDKGARGAQAAAENLTDKVRDTVKQPREGDTKSEGGVEYVLRDGRWHRAHPLVDPQIELAEDKEDLAEEMLKDPHSAKAHTLIHAIVGKQRAVEEPDPVAADTSDDDMDPSSPNYRYRDTGYVPGSRKEMASEQIKRAGRTGERLRASDIDWDEVEQNPREAKKLIIKSNLFGQVDWEALKAGGMQPAAGYLIDRVYASVGPEPAADTRVTREDYALGLETIRDRLEQCKAPEEVTDVLTTVRDEMLGVMLTARESEEYKAASEIAQQLTQRVRAARDESDKVYQAWSAAQNELRGIEYDRQKRVNRKWKPDPKLESAIAVLQRKVDETHAAFMAYRAAHPELQTEKRDLGGGSFSYDSAIEYDARQAWNIAQLILSAAKQRNLMSNPMTRAWSALGNRFIAVLNYRSYKGSDAFGEHVTAAKNNKIVDWSWAEKESTARPGVTKKQVQFQLKVAESFDRAGGRAVSVESTQALKAMFGLRDVQSGNWVLNDVNSAAFHVQKSAEAFADLADITGIRDDDVSMRGRLALAFGARGHGNTGFGGAARAHYEPVHRVINLTKMGGGGTLAHEWFHAVDNLIKESEGAGSADADDFISENPAILPPGELRDAFSGLQAAMMTGDKRTREKIVYSDKDYRTAKYNIDNPMNSVTKVIKNAGGAAEAVIAVDEYYRRQYGDLGKLPKSSAKQYTQWRRLAAAYYDGNPKGAEAMVATGPARSSYAYEAVNLDAGSGDKYWSKGREMAARAFQAWTEDRLATQGRRDDYLSIYADNKYYNDPLFGPTFPFPEGEERVRINSAFDRLFGVISAQGTLAKALDVVWSGPLDE